MEGPDSRAGREQRPGWHGAWSILTSLLINHLAAPWSDHRRALPLGSLRWLQLSLALCEDQQGPCSDRRLDLPYSTRLLMIIKIKPFPFPFSSRAPGGSSQWDRPGRLYQGIARYRRSLISIHSLTPTVTSLSARHSFKTYALFAYASSFSPPPPVGLLQQGTPHLQRLEAG